MPKNHCTIANYIFPCDQLRAIQMSGLEDAESVEALARKLLNDQLKDKKYELV